MLAEHTPLRIVSGPNERRVRREADRTGTRARSVGTRPRWPRAAKGIGAAGVPAEHTPLRIVSGPHEWWLRREVDRTGTRAR
ncbi:hypothetical protein Aglo03_42270 [Actinokineospora globicatena]|uniref:Uncharacterized protein n=1 Tax=Actinokineospora globicatena TaxID=103729 RepID=A0A9W6VBQ6_9PSEU|nr:hypothetical protein Aglo03_42270 [Actinokineospora globicatena]